MLKYHLKAGVSRLALAHVLRAAERAAARAPGAVVHPDGTPVLTCDLRLLRPYRLDRRDDGLFELRVA